MKNKIISKHNNLVAFVFLIAFNINNLFAQNECKNLLGNCINPTTGAKEYFWMYRGSHHSGQLFDEYGYYNNGNKIGVWNIEKLKNNTEFEFENFVQIDSTTNLVYSYSSSDTSKITMKIFEEKLKSELIWITDPQTGIQKEEYGEYWDRKLIKEFIYSIKR